MKAGAARLGSRNISPAAERPLSRHRVHMSGGVATGHYIEAVCPVTCLTRRVVAKMGITASDRASIN